MRWLALARRLAVTLKAQGLDVASRASPVPKGRFWRGAGIGVSAYCLGGLGFANILTLFFQLNIHLDYVIIDPPDQVLM